MGEQLEEPTYDLIARHDGFEVRRYHGSIEARTRTDGVDLRSRSHGFRRVATYIFGGNARRQRIAMTAPVHLWQDEEGGHLAFTMPAQHALDRLPDPLDDGIRIQSLDEHLVAVLPFSGWSRPPKVARLEAELMALVIDAGYAVTGPARLALYDNPNTTLPFQRRNKIHLPIGEPQASNTRSAI